MAFRIVVDGIDEEQPCEDDQRAAAADGVASLLGFGVFLDDDAIRMELNSGYRHSYRVEVRNPETALGGVEFVVDIALFLTLHGLSPDGAQRFLKPRLAALLKPAMKDAAVFRPALLEAQAATRQG